MLNGLINPLRRRIAQSLNWRIAQIKSDVVADSQLRIHQVQTQIDQLNMVVTNMSVTFCDQQKVQAVLLEQLCQQIAKLEKDAQVHSGVEA